VFHARTKILLAVAIATLAATGAIAQVATSVGRGTVVDHQGNPLGGVVLVFQNTGNETSRFETTTNKKGRFYIDNLLYNNVGRWLVTAQLDGYVATSMKVESRTQQAVIGKVEFKLSPTENPKEIDIRPFGTATFEIEMIPEAVWAERNAPVETEETAAIPGEEGQATARARPSEDPFQAAFRLANEGDLAGSLPFFEKAAQADPEDSELLEGWANVLYRLQRTDEAIDQARRASELDPDRPGPYKLLFSAQAAKQDWPAARATLAAMETRFAGDRWVLEQRAVLAAREGDLQGEIDAREALVARDPGDKESWVALGSLYADAGNPQKSQAAFQKVVEIDPSGAYRTFYNIGALIRRKPDVPAAENERAIVAFRKAIEIKPDYAPAHRELANALLAKGDLAGARESLRRYLEHAPDAEDAPQVRAMLKSLGG